LAALARPSSKRCEQASIPGRDAICSSVAAMAPFRHHDDVRFNRRPQPAVHQPVRRRRSLETSGLGLDGSRSRALKRLRPGRPGTCGRRAETVRGRVVMPNPQVIRRRSTNDREKAWVMDRRVQRSNSGNAGRSGHQFTIAIVKLMASETFAMEKHIAGCVGVICELLSTISLPPVRLDLAVGDSPVGQRCSAGVRTKPQNTGRQGRAKH